MLDLDSGKEKNLFFEGKHFLAQISVFEVEKIVFVEALYIKKKLAWNTERTATNSLDTTSLYGCVRTKEWEVIFDELPERDDFTNCEGLWLVLGVEEL